MKERMTDRARKVLSLASAEAIKLKHPYIGTEHLLLGLIREGGGVAASALQELGLSMKAIRAKVESMVAVGTEEPSNEQLPMTPKALQAIQIAHEQAAALSHNYVGTEHLLMGLVLQEDGIAAQVLSEMGVDGNDVRQQIMELLGQPVAQGIPDLGQALAAMAGRGNAEEADGDGDAAPALPEEDRLCLRGANEIQELKDLALAVGRLLEEKDQAVADENFERAAELRDAIAAVASIVAEAKGKWAAGPNTTGA